MKISVAMATYNGARHLQEQLDSLTTQVRRPDELVVCDDRSTDSTMAILNAFKNSAPFPVHIFQNEENLGHEVNFGKSIDACDGEIVFLCDQDDVWFPEKISEIERMFVEDARALLIINDVSITDGDLHPTGRTVLGQTRAAGILGKNAKSLTLGCATAFRSNLRLLISPVPALEYGHDSWIHDFTHILDGRRILPDTLQLYRRHGNNVSNWAFDGTARATMRDVVLPSAGKDLTPEYSKRREALALMASRVTALGPQVFARIGASRNYHDVLDEMESARAALARRIQIFKANWIARKRIAICMWLRNDYRYFLGWRSFIKDLLR